MHLHYSLIGLMPSPLLLGPDGLNQIRMILHESTSNYRSAILIANKKNLQVQLIKQSICMYIMPRVHKQIYSYTSTEHISNHILQLYIIIDRFNDIVKSGESLKASSIPEQGRRLFNKPSAFYF